jgi:chloramphenicol 3-O phosphotransferase
MGNPGMGMSAKIFLLNGASSSGKSTLGRALHKKMGTPFLYFSSDQLVQAEVLPDLTGHPGESQWEWENIRPRFFDGFHRCIKALADAGNDLIVEHVIERRTWFEDCVSLLSRFDTFYVGVHCPLEELERRERLRGDRAIGEGRSHLRDGIHTWGPYDFEVDTSSLDPERNAELVLSAFHARQEAGVFKKLAGTIPDKPAR